MAQGNGEKRELQFSLRVAVVIIGLLWATTTAFAGVIWNDLSKKLDTAIQDVGRLKTDVAVLQKSVTDMERYGPKSGPYDDPTRGNHR